MAFEKLRHYFGGGIRLTAGAIQNKIDSRKGGKAIISRKLAHEGEMGLPRLSKPFFEADLAAALEGV